MSTRPNGIYCHRNNYDVLGTSHDSLEVILYTDNEDNHRNFHPQQGLLPQEHPNGSFLPDVVRDPILSDNEELERDGDGEEDIFQMDDIPNELSASITSLSCSPTSNASDDSTNTAKLSATSSPTTSYQYKPLDPPSSPIQVRYYVPTNEAPQGLSQSVTTTTVDHNFIRRHLNCSQRPSRLRSTSYALEEDSSGDSLSFAIEEDIVNAVINSDDSSQYIVPFPSSWSITDDYVPHIYSQSAPMISYLMDDISFNRATVALSLSNTESLQSGRDSVDQNDSDNNNDDNDKHSNDSVSSIRTVRALSFQLELEMHEAEPLVQPPEIVRVENQDNLALAALANTNEWVETGSINSVYSTSEKKQDDIKSTLSETVHEKDENQAESTSTNDFIQDAEVGNNSDENESWTILADQRYGPLPELQSPNQLSSTEESRWERIHQTPDLLEKLKHNEFVFNLLNKYSFPLKVTSIPYATRYKCLQNHFFNPSVLYIRYIRYKRCAYIVYRNFTEMLKGYHTLSSSVIEGAVIRCEPSTMQELEYDLNREEQRRLSFKNSRHTNTQRRPFQGNNRNHRTLAKYNYRDTFFPSMHSILPEKKNNNMRNNSKSNYDASYDYLSQTFVYDGNLAGLIPCFTPYDCSPSTPYYMRFPHPHQSNTAMIPLPPENWLSASQSRRNNNKNGRRPLPEKILQLPVLPVQYIIMKPNTKQDYSLAGRIQYYPISPKRCADVLNYVFQISSQVVFLFSIKGSGAFQNYAIMSSEIMDLQDLSLKDIEGTSFETLGTNFKTGKGSNKTCWRYVCRVEWKPARPFPMSQIGHCVNAWNNNRLIRYSKDVTFLEPAIGKTMVDFMSSLDQDS